MVCFYSLFFSTVALNLFKPDTEGLFQILPAAGVLASVDINAAVVKWTFLSLLPTQTGLSKRLMKCECQFSAPPGGWVTSSESANVMNKS